MPARILVVDDNPVNLKLICDLLECEGYDVERAPDAEAAQVMLRSRTLGLILMDVSLPGMDGLTLTRLLKANEATRHIPVIAVTALAMKGDEEKAFEAGCEGYISKPLDTRRLVLQVASLLQSRTGEKTDKGVLA